MEKLNNFSRLVALILFIAMSLSVFAGCVPGNGHSGDNGGSTGGDEIADPNPNPNPNPDPEEPETPDSPGTHTCVFGEWVVVKVPTTDTEGLQERKCECGEVEQKVIPASGTEFVIYYNNYKTAEYPTPNGYNTSDGLLQLPKPEVEGYTFIGWYTKSIGGEIVDYIPKGSTGDVVLYAHWDLITYDITYRNVPNNTNLTSYNIETKLKLVTPKWDGLEFAYWTDDDGNVYMPDGNITALPEKMTGDLMLTANWKVRRNLVTQTEDPTFNTGFSTDDGYLFFWYKLGIIEHVVLDSKDDINNGLYYKSEGIQINYTLSNTVTISEETAESISNTISKSVSQSSTVSATDHWAENESKNWNSEIGGSFGFDYEVNCGFGKNGISAGMSMEINGKTGKGGSEGTNSGWEKSNSTTNSSSTENSESVSSSLAFMKQISTTKEETIYVGEDQPSGYYTFVHAGDIEVYAIVMYDTATGALSMSTYSYLDNMHSMVMYYPDAESISNPATDTLDFTIPKEKIVNIIENSYYVKYDANGGEGKMPTTVHTINGTESLATNEFSRPGYEFTGWELSTEDGVSIILDGQSVTNLAKPLQTITLKALWASTGPVYSEWSEWSEWSLDRRETSDLVREEVATMWSYYYFKCPSCGIHMHGWDITCPTWAGGCGKAYIPENSWKGVFSATSYTSAGLKEWYGTGKYYAKIDGQVVFKASKGQVTVYRYSTRTVEGQ